MTREGKMRATRRFFRPHFFLIVGWASTAALSRGKKVTLNWSQASANVLLFNEELDFKLSINYHMFSHICKSCTIFYDVNFLFPNLVGCGGLRGLGKVAFSKILELATICILFEPCHLCILKTSPKSSILHMLLGISPSSGLLELVLAPSLEPSDSSTSLSLSFSLSHPPGLGLGS